MPRVEGFAFHFLAFVFLLFLPNCRQQQNVLFPFLICCRSCCFLHLFLVASCRGLCALGSMWILATFPPASNVPFVCVCVCVSVCVLHCRLFFLPIISFSSSSLHRCECLATAATADDQREKMKMKRKKENLISIRRRCQWNVNIWNGAGRICHIPIFCIALLC